MIDTNQIYQQLSKSLNKTRKSLSEACNELNIDNVNFELLQPIIDQCSHCNIWSNTLVPDLDNNPICKVCVNLSGL
jgi:hypothetical protein